METIVSIEGKFPWGARFSLTNEQAIMILQRKINLGERLDIMPEMEVYKDEPWLIPFVPCRLCMLNQWYCFARRVRAGRRGTRPRRAINGGRWKSTGKGKKILSSSGETVGYKQSLVFFKIDADKNETPTSWHIKEFRLKSKGFQELVLCDIRLVRTNVRFVPPVQVPVLVPVQVPPPPVLDDEPQPAAVTQQPIQPQPPAVSQRVNRLQYLSNQSDTENEFLGGSPNFYVPQQVASPQGVLSIGGLLDVQETACGIQNSATVIEPQVASLQGVPSGYEALNPAGSAFRGGSFSNIHSDNEPQQPELYNNPQDGLSVEFTDIDVMHQQQPVWDPQVDPAQDMTIDSTNGVFNFCAPQEHVTQLQAASPQGVLSIGGFLDVQETACGIQNSAPVSEFQVASLQGVPSGYEAPNPAGGAFGFGGSSLNNHSDNEPQQPTDFYNNPQGGRSVEFTDIDGLVSGSLWNDNLSFDSVFPDTGNNLLVNEPQEGRSWLSPDTRVGFSGTDIMQQQLVWDPQVDPVQGMSIDSTNRVSQLQAAFPQAVLSGTTGGFLDVQETPFGIQNSAPVFERLAAFAPGVTSGSVGGFSNVQGVPCGFPYIGGGAHNLLNHMGYGYLRQ